ncbi:hypothetical protein CTKZ_21940 [Cellulomonas algicola]|uniref:ComEC/Rec2-related protein domain-containing protein n=1 Tax=Cellulomonas algicola TaxID=2071633 RepID=A0A401V147_9CELL|nr:ComEC/Rec2 family competence protein [Cellulomonas algicola]GCD20632.1 hypothetical protein CTKZ_21940 [Cellulomonas algicola]
MVDLRLVAPALVAWLAACVVVRQDATTGRMVACACAAGALSVFAAAGVRSGRHTGRTARAGPGPASWGASVALALVVAAAVLGAGAAHVAARDALAVGVSASGPDGMPSADATAPDSLGTSADGAAAGAKGTTTVTGTVDGLARPLASSWPGAPPRARVDVRVEHMGSGATATERGGSVVVLGPGSWAGVRPGERVVVAGRWSVLPRGDRAAAILVTDDAPTVVAHAPPLHVVAGALRETVDRQADRLPGDAGALLPGVTVGDTARVPDDLRDALRVSGLTHLTAVSGAHFALVGALVVAGVGALGAPRAVRAGAVLLVGGALVTLVGASPSVLRAAVMAVVGCGGMLLGRRAAAPAALSTSVVVLLVVDPWLATELGFVLSVLATGGLVLLGGPLAERWSTRLPRPLATALAAPVAAQVACAPVVLLVTPTVSVLAVPANMLAAPAVAPATVLGLAAAVVGTWWPAGGDVVAGLAGAACWWVGTVARAVAGTPGAAVTWLPGVPGVILLAVAGAATVRLSWPSREPP